MNSSVKKLLLVAVAVVICFIPHLGSAAPPDDDATCDISVTVDSIMEWAGNFTAIVLANMTSQAATPSDNETQTIYANCNFDISADNTIASELNSATDELVTKYLLDDDGDGSIATGATPGDKLASDIITWTDYDSFLSTPLVITHVDADGAVQITLSVQASNLPGNVADSGAYSAQQTLTASWISD